MTTIKTKTIFLSHRNPYNSHTLLVITFRQKVLPYMTNYLIMMLSFQFEMAETSTQTRLHLDTNRSVRSNGRMEKVETILMIITEISVMLCRAVSRTLYSPGGAVQNNEIILTELLLSRGL